MKLMTPSQQVVKTLQQRFGSANFSKWQSIRRIFYSFVKYTSGGLSEIRFFGTALGGANRQLTNIPKANSFGQNHFMLKTIRATFYIPSIELDLWNPTATDPETTTLVSDLVNGVFQGGVLEFSIGSRIQVQVPKPFLFAPPADGRPQIKTAGLPRLTLSSATPDALANASMGLPHAQLTGSKRNLYRVDPNVVIEAEQNFECVLKYPSGALNYLATGVINDSTNPLYVGVFLDGLLFRPQQ